MEGEDEEKQPTAENGEPADPEADLRTGPSEADAGAVDSDAADTAATDTAAPGDVDADVPGAGDAGTSGEPAPGVPDGAGSSRPSETDRDASDVTDTASSGDSGGESDPPGPEEAEKGGSEVAGTDETVGAGLGDDTSSTDREIPQHSPDEADNVPKRNATASEPHADTAHTSDTSNTSRQQDPRDADNSDTEDGAAAEPVAVRGWRGRRPGAARTLAWTTTGLALALILFALLVPNDITRLTPSRFVRIPAEGILGAALLLALPPKPRRVAAVLAGVGLGVLSIVKILDMGSYWTLDRPFDLVLDWILLDDAHSFMKDSLGDGATLAATIGVIALAASLPVLMTLAVVRLSRLMVRNRPTAGRTLLVLGTAWITCSTLTLEISGVPLASHSAATLVENRVEAVRKGLRDGEAFKKQAAIDAFADTPPDQLLTGLRGKDVLITFIESYGRSAIDDPHMGVPLGETLAEKTKELKDAGYASRSGWLRSPITGAGSWLGHSTFLSGLWIKNQSRYNNLVASDRLTLTEAFRRTGDWRTVGVVPGTQKAWPEGKYFGLDHIYDSDQLGYRGPKFSWSTMPDQYTLKAFEKLEHGKADRKPMMAEIILTSSHNPWAPIPRTIPEDQVGDGSIYHSLQKAEGKDPKEVWKNSEDVQTEYRKSIQYSVTSLVDYVAKYGSKDTVLIFLGDHQPNRTVTGDNPSHDVPVSIVAQDPDVLDRISDWGWTDGLKPASDAPEWRMDKFRDRFMTAFGSQPTGASQ